MNTVRRSGILLPVFSLYGNYGIGTLGSAAYDFVDFLSRSGQYYWQILPVNPTSYGNSPYQSPSVFAGNPYFIDPDILVRDGLLSRDEVLPHISKNSGRVDYGRLYRERMPLLKKAAEGVSDKDSEYLAFTKENAFWLGDYGAFAAMKERNGMLPHYKWTEKITDVTAASQEGIIHCKIQFLFYRQWLELKKYANTKGVHIIGDLPIYPSLDSSDYYFGRNNFLPGTLAACPPDSFNANGQLWGNPIYDWKKMTSEGFFWWKARLRQASQLFDTVRIDHFRGIYEYYCVPENARTAIDGSWQKGPGMTFVKMIKEHFPDLDIIAEDLGFLTEGTRRFFRDSGFDGMKVLQFAFGGGDSEYLPHNYRENAVAYTGTHDNPTVVEWMCRAPEKELVKAMDYLGAASASRLCDSFIRAVLSSVCSRAIIPLQDWLHLGCSGRINTPGTVGNNWQYRIKEEDISNNISEKILYYTQLYIRKKE